MWDVVTVDRFDQRFLGLSEAEQKSILTGIFKLRAFGPLLGRPDADSLKGSGQIKNLKELRVRHRGKLYQVFFVFDLIRQAVLSNHDPHRGS